MDDQPDFTLDFIGIGAQKAGTTWLAQCLAEHPQLFIPRRKELNYWNRTKDCPAAPSKQYTGFREYRQQFREAPDNAKLGEFSTHYLYDPVSPGLIREAFPEVRIIAILRDPIKRALSQYYHTKKLIPLDASFEESLQIYPEFLERGLYYEQLLRFFNTFPGEQIHVVIYEQLKKEPRETLKKLYAFLGVDAEYVPAALERQVNVRKQVSRPWLRNAKNMFKRLPGGRALIRFLSQQGYQSTFEQLYTDTDTSSYELNPGLQQQLSEYFRDDKLKLERLLKRDIPYWSV